MTHGTACWSGCRITLVVCCYTLGPWSDLKTQVTSRIPRKQLPAATAAANARYEMLRSRCGGGATSGSPNCCSHWQLRPVLECEDTEGRPWAAGWVHSDQQPLQEVSCFFLPQRPISCPHAGHGRGSSRISLATLEPPVPWRVSSGLGLAGQRETEVGRPGLCARHPSQHPQPQLSLMSLLSSWMWSVLFSLNMGPPCRMMSSVATRRKASSTLLESLADVSMAHKIS